MPVMIIALCSYSIINTVHKNKWRGKCSTLRTVVAREVKIFYILASLMNIPQCRFCNKHIMHNTRQIEHIIPNKFKCSIKYILSKSDERIISFSKHEMIILETLGWTVAGVEFKLFLYKVHLSLPVLVSPVYFKR
jgi:hypothetical protein